MIILLAIIIRYNFAVNNEIIGEYGVYEVEFSSNLVKQGKLQSYFLDVHSLYDSMPFEEKLHTPLYRIFLGSFFYIFGAGFMQAKALSVIFGTLVVIITYLIARKLFNEKMGLIAALLVALSKPLVISSSIVLNETAFGLFILLSVYIFSFKSRKMIMLGSFFLFITFMINPKTIFFIAFFLLYSYFSDDRKFRSTSLLIALFLMIIFSSVYYEDSIGFKESLVNYLPEQLIEKAYGLDPNDLIVRGDVGFDNIVDKTLEESNVLELFYGYAINIFKQVFIHLPLILGFGFIFLLISFSELKNRKLLSVMVFLFTVMAYSVGSLHDFQRYLIPALPLIYILFAVYFFRIGKKNNILAIALLLVTIFSPYMIRNVYDYMYNEPDFFDDIMIESCGNDSVLISYHPQPAYYEKARWAGMPYMKFEDLRQRIKDLDGEFIIIYHDDAIYYPGVIEKIDEVYLLIQETEEYKVYLAANDR